MALPDFYSEKKWCGWCYRNVQFLMSIRNSYCIRCSGIVTILPRKEWDRLASEAKRLAWREEGREKLRRKTKLSS